MNKYRMSAVYVGTLLFLHGTAHADILHVPGEYLTTQAALVYAGTGDTIMVAPGTYYEHIVWPNTQGIHLVSESGAESTTIDAAGSLPVITIETDIDSTTVIKGFTITNGGAGYGGGIYCIGASPTISHNKIMSNSAIVSGSGIFYDNGSPTIIQNMIFSNVSGTGGGAITCWSSYNSKILYNIIQNNYGGAGGGISAINSQPMITGNTVNDNSAVHGGGMYFFKSSPIVDYNTVSNNDADYGAGLYFSQSSGDICYNNIFSNGCGMLMVDPGQINAEYNWWGDATGPYHPTLNPGGLGDTVSDYVDFDPWLYNPWGIEEEPIVKPVEQQSTIGATIFRGPLQLPKDKKCKVFDITGRVVEPTTITHGIYFIEIDSKIVHKVIKVR